MSEFDIRNTDLKETEKEFERALRPLNFGDFQGQKKIVENLEIFVRAAKMRGESLDHEIAAAGTAYNRWTMSSFTGLPDWGKRLYPPLLPTNWG